MYRQNGLFYSSIISGRCIDKQQVFAAVFYFALPSVHGRDARHDVHARRELLLYQSFRNLRGAGGVGAGGEDELGAFHHRKKITQIWAWRAERTLFFAFRRSRPGAPD